MEGHRPSGTPLRPEPFAAADEPGASARWQPVAGWQVGVLAIVAIVVLYFANSGDRWMPLLDSANLIFHEAGHPIVGLFNGRLGVYGGTLGQLAFPLLAAVSFRRRGDALATAFSLLWLFQNFFNIARYMADARAQVLPLLGGDHDWTEIFSRWNVLHFDTRIAGLVSFIAFAGVIATCLGLAWFCWQQQAQERALPCLRTKRPRVGERTPGSRRMR